MNNKTKHISLLIAFLVSFIFTTKAFPFPADIEDISGKKYFQKTKQSLVNAKESIHVVMFVMRVSKQKHNTKPQQLVNELINAHKRGVDVEVILDQNIDFLNKRSKKLQKEIKSMEAYKQLRDAGVKVYYDDSTRYTHAKVIVIDGATVILGSTNWTKAALERNIEVSVLINSDQMAKEILEYIKQIKRNKEIETYVSKAQEVVPVKIEFMKNPEHGPQMVHKHAERVFDVYLFLLKEYDGNTEGRITLFYDTVAKYLGMDLTDRTAYRRQIIKVLRKLETRHKLIKYVPRHAKEARITLLDYDDSEKAYSDPKKNLFELPEDYFDYGWRGNLSFSGKYCYFINLINAGANGVTAKRVSTTNHVPPRRSHFVPPTRSNPTNGVSTDGVSANNHVPPRRSHFVPPTRRGPPTRSNIVSGGVWSESLADITEEYGGVSQDVICKGMDELRRKRLIEVAYDTLTGKPYEKRSPKIYKVLKLYDFEKLLNKLKKVEDKYGKKEYNIARGYAQIVFEEYHPEAIEDIILKTKEYGKEKVEKAFDIVAQKNKDNPKRKYSYVVGVLENWGIKK
ncbi:MAG: phospholipase D-like domain-containing protein [Candidatus Ancaeobacter aquaticus]|nr:phospholipase D-like domain-containing protein [Candidatus Ancaeobacter aquaticus]